MKKPVPNKRTEFCEELGINITIVEWTEDSKRYVEREYITKKHNVKYGKKLYNLDKSKNLTESELDIVCMYISKGNSVNKSYKLMLEYFRGWEGFEEQMNK